MRQEIPVWSPALGVAYGLRGLPSDPETTWRSYIEGPRFAAFPKAIKNACWERSLKIHMEVDKGWIRETVRFEITGPSSKVRELQRAIDAGIDEYNNRGKENT